MPTYRDYDGAYEDSRVAQYLGGKAKNFTDNVADHLDALSDAIGIEVSGRFATSQLWEVKGGVVDYIEEPASEETYHFIKALYAAYLREACISTLDTGLNVRWGTGFYGEPILVAGTRTIARPLVWSLNLVESFDDNGSECFQRFEHAIIRGEPFLAE